MEGTWVRVANIFGLWLADSANQISPNCDLQALARPIIKLFDHMHLSCNILSIYSVIIVVLVVHRSLYYQLLTLQILTDNNAICYIKYTQAKDSHSCKFNMLLHRHTRQSTNIEHVQKKIQVETHTNTSHCTNAIKILQIIGRYKYKNDIHK